VGRDGKALETRFFVKVFIGLAPEEVEIEQEIEVLGDLDLEDDTSVEGAESLEEEGEDASESTEIPPPIPPEPSFPPSKERRWEGETFRASSSGLVGEEASGSGGDPPPFVASDPFPSVAGSNPPSIHLTLDTLTSSAAPSIDPPPPMSPINELSSPSQPPPFSELPPPPPSFQPLSHQHHHHRSPSAPPPTFLESEASSSSSTISSLVLGSPISPFPFNNQPTSIVARSSAVVRRSSPLNAPSILPPLPLPLSPPRTHAPTSSTSNNPASLPPSWIEYDGYEQFSDPPPPLSISFSTTSSVDPPREGEISSLAVEQMEEMIHSLTIESGAGGVGTSPSVRVDDPNDLPPTFGALDAGSSSGSGLVAGEGRDGNGGGVGSSRAGVVGVGGGGGAEGAVLPPSYAGDGIQGGLVQQEEPPQYS